jgi:hypothetical protein
MRRAQGQALVPVHDFELLAFAIQLAATDRLFCREVGCRFRAACACRLADSLVAGLLARSPLCPRLFSAQL